jgi:hypothetical protein
LLSLSFLNYCGSFNFEKKKINFILLLKYITLFIVSWRHVKQRHHHLKLQTRTVITICTLNKKRWKYWITLLHYWIFINDRILTTLKSLHYRNIGLGVHHVTGLHRWEVDRFTLNNGSSGCVYAVLLPTNWITSVSESTNRFRSTKYKAW